MLKNATILCALVALSACGDPLRDMPRLSDVDLATTDPVRQAVPTEAEIAREGFPAASQTDFAYAGALAARSSTPVKPRSLWGTLRDAVPTPPVRAAAQTRTLAEGTQTEDLILSPPAADTVLARVDPSDAPAPARKNGFFDRLANPSRTSTSTAARKGVDTLDVTYGTVLPYGTIARVCDAQRQLKGLKVESASARGYDLYDSAPGTSGPRTYYITGFDDNCPRQLTAAHVVLGAPSFYELLRYGPAGAHLVRGETDRAYEKVKSRVCGARAGKPCGAKMKTLERNTFFVTAYERMNDNTHWSELLVHDGAVVAAALKAN